MRGRRRVAGSGLAGAGALAAALAAAGCGPWMPLPETGTHEGDQPVFVPEAPPAPHVEILPPEPEDEPDAVWVDGQWLFRARRWEWEPGRWEVPPPGGTYAPAAIVYLPDSRIAWYAGRWHVPASR